MGRASAALAAAACAALGAAVQVRDEGSWEQDETGYKLIKGTGFSPKDILDVNFDQGEWARVQKKKIFPRAKFHSSECAGVDECLEKEGLADTTFELLRFDGKDCSNLEGSGKTLDKATALQIKVPFAKHQTPSFSQYIWEMAERHYTAFDITGLHISPSGYPAQMDMLFLKENCTHHLAAVKEIVDARRKGRANSKVQTAPSNYDKLRDLGFKPNRILDISRDTRWRQSVAGLFPDAEVKTGDVDDPSADEGAEDEHFDLIHLDVPDAKIFSAIKTLKKSEVFEARLPFVDIENTLGREPFFAILQRFLGAVGFEPFGLPERRRAAGKGYLKDISMIFIKREGKYSELIKNADSEMSAAPSK